MHVLLGDTIGTIAGAAICFAMLWAVDRFDAWRMKRRNGE